MISSRKRCAQIGHHAHIPLGMLLSVVCLALICWAWFAENTLVLLRLQDSGVTAAAPLLIGTIVILHAVCLSRTRLGRSQVTGAVGLLLLSYGLLCQVDYVFAVYATEVVRLRSAALQVEAQGGLPQLGGDIKRLIDMVRVAGYVAFFVGAVLLALSCRIRPDTAGKHPRNSR